MKIKDIRINPKNPRYIKDDRFLKLKNNIVEFPKMMKLRPIIIDDAGMILGGNMRYLALVDLGYKDIPEGWVVKASELTEEERKQFTILDNVPFGDWDYDLLANEWEMEKLQDWGIDKAQLEGAVINADDMEDTYDIDQPTEGEQPKPNTKPGQMWQLGEHRLLCGDSRKTEDIKRLMDGEQADMVFTDPPYNVNYSGQGKLGSIMNDNMTEEEFVSFTMDYMTAMKDNLKEGGVFYLCSGWSSYPIFVYAIKATGMVFANPIVWVKNNTTLGWNDYKYKYEMVVKGKKKKVAKKRTSPIIYGWNAGKHYFKDTRFESDVWEIKRRASNTMVHPTQKPLALINKAIGNSSKQKEIVLDPFGGSGGTLISCVRLHRKCRINELDPVYCDAIIKRWEIHTNEKAVLII